MRVIKETLHKTLEVARQIDFHPNISNQRLIAVQTHNVNDGEDA
jgi:DNA-binding LacI/PurR family transcriptional regulator